MFDYYSSFYHIFLVMGRMVQKIPEGIPNGCYLKITTAKSNEYLFTFDQYVALIQRHRLKCLCLKHYGQPSCYKKNPFPKLDSFNHFEKSMKNNGCSLEYMHWMLGCKHPTRQSLKVCCEKNYLNFHTYIGDEISTPNMG